MTFWSWAEFAIVLLHRAHTLPLRKLWNYFDQFGKIFGTDFEPHELKNKTSCHANLSSMFRSMKILFHFYNSSMVHSDLFELRVKCLNPYFCSKANFENKIPLYLSCLILYVKSLWRNKLLGLFPDLVLLRLSMDSLKTKQICVNSPEQMFLTFSAWGWSFPKVHISKTPS